MSGIEGRSGAAAWFGDGCGSRETLFGQAHKRRDIETTVFKREATGTMISSGGGRNGRGRDSQGGGPQRVRYQKITVLQRWRCAGSSNGEFGCPGDGLGVRANTS